MIQQFPVTKSRSAPMLWLTVALAFINLSHATAQQAPRPVETAAVKSSSGILTAKMRVEVFEEVWMTINEKYYDPKFNGVDWNAVRERYRPMIEAARSETEFYDILGLMVGQLRDAHTRVRSPRQREERKNRQATSAGVLIYEVEGTPVVLSIAPDSDAARAGVLPGMTVRSVNGLPVREAINHARREVGASSSERAARLLSYSRLVAGEPGTQLTLGLLRADSTAFDVSLTRRTVSVGLQLETRLLPSGYAYIKFNRFVSPLQKQVKEALIKFKDAPGLILDLRSNGGGDGEIGLQTAGYFFNDKTPFAKIITRTGKPPSAFFGLVKLPKEFAAGEKGKQLYSNPVVILINEATGSTAELFAGAMQEQNRARIIGTQSCGCVLGVLNHKKLNGGGDLAISEIGFVTAKGRTLEGHGVMPDQPVVVTLADIQHQRDAALEQAVMYFDHLLKKN